MGSYKHSYIWHSAIVGVIIGSLLMYFNVFDVHDHKLIAFSILLAATVIGIFVGKIVELKWIDVGFPFGVLIGGAIAYLIEQWV